MKKRVQASVRMLSFCLLACVPLATLADVYVIVNAGNSTKSMNADQVERIFLGKTKRFENGDGAEPVNQKDGSEARNVFNDKILRRSDQQLKYYWARKMFSGGDKPPPVVYNGEDVEDFVAGRPGGIGYLLRPPTLKDVKVVLRVKN